MRRPAISRKTSQMAKNPGGSGTCNAMDIFAPIAFEPGPLEALDTGDPRLAKILQQLRRVLGRNIPILLQGETGVGKDVLARAIHAAGPGSKKPFVAVNCAALPENLIESELFGHAPGAFTGAKRDGAVGRIREAHGGTLFLDEIGDMPVALQTRLLRVLEDGFVTPIGGKPVPVNFALISATNADIKARIADQNFRADLYYRLNGFSVLLPPLRERTDSWTLTRAMLDREAASLGGREIKLSPELEAAFASYAWPGNLRQLATMLRTACLMLDEGEFLLRPQHLSEADLAELTAKPAARFEPQGSLREKSDAMIAATVAATNGNIAAAARRLNISRNTLYRRLSAGQSAH
jgi:transcriptional regulator of acetoin/glycerol metabolism